MGKFKVKAGGRYRGKSGTVYQVLDNSDNEHWPLCSDHEPFETRHFWLTDGTAWVGHKSGGDKLVRAAFNVGDRVRVIDENGGGKIGDEATITAIREYPPESGDGNFCELDGLSKGAIGLYESRLELIEPDAATAENWDFDPRRELKVGDRVRALIDDGYRGFKAGDTFVISGVEDNCIRFLDNDGDGRLRPIADFELLPPATTPSSEPDTDLSVRVVADMSQLDGEIDRIMRRLKKVKKKARKLGIRLEFRDAA